jgi:2-polyprenyl-3-methyl-5-hydroxy-6-metoxy-1,4-benzoquinol methylase
MDEQSNQPEQPNEPAFDEARSQAFMERMQSLWNASALALMISVGHQTGLFDALAGLPPSTSRQIAAASGLDERYVHEWLGALVTGQIITYNPENATYFLPPEHARWLSRAAGPDNLAEECQFVALFGEVESEVVTCFRQGGGVPYSRFPRFQRLQAESSDARFDAFLLSNTIDLVSGLRERLAEGIAVLDVGCGQGHAINLLARAFPQSQCVGYDFAEEGVATAMAEADQWGLPNARFKVQDLAAMDDRATFDFITAFDAIHDQARPDLVLQAIARALRPSGVFLMADVAASSRLEENMAHPLGPYLYTTSTFHCMTVSLALGGMGLGTVWGREKAVEMLYEAGFTQVSVQSLTEDTFNCYYISRR